VGGKGFKNHNCFVILSVVEGSLSLFWAGGKGLKTPIPTSVNPWLPFGGNQTPFLRLQAS